MMATDKQIDFILSLAGVRFLDKVFRATGVILSSREESGVITKARASEIIDELKALKAR